MVHSLEDLDEVEIISEKDNNHVTARYKGKLYTAIYNIFTGLYYVDDKYGEIKEEGAKKTVNNNFRGSRHKTIGIENEINELSQGIMWGLIDHNISKGLDMDYLQVFKLGMIGKGGIQTQKITHSQEVPERKLENKVAPTRLESKHNKKAPQSGQKKL